MLHHFTHKPDTMTWESAAGVSTTAEAALRSLDLLALEPGQILLIDGVAGGVGRAAAQFALSDGVRVLGTARESNHTRLRELGVDPITYGAGLAERVGCAIPGAVVNGALDTAGMGSITELAELTGEPHRVVTIADFSDSVPGVHVRH